MILMIMVMVEKVKGNDFVDLLYSAIPNGGAIDILTDIKISCTTFSKCYKIRFYSDCNSVIIREESGDDSTLTSSSQASTLTRGHHPGEYDVFDVSLWSDSFLH